MAFCINRYHQFVTKLLIEKSGLQNTFISLTIQGNIIFKHISFYDFGRKQ